MSYASRFTSTSPPTPWRAARILMLPLALLAAAAVSCSDPAEPTEVTLDAISLAPANLTMKVGETATITATLMCNCGLPVTRTLSWTTSDAAVATVNAAGHVTAIAVGSATVTASAEGKAAQATVSVTAAGTLIGPSGGTAVSADG